MFVTVEILRRKYIIVSHSLPQLVPMERVWVETFLPAKLVKVVGMRNDMPIKTNRVETLITHSTHT